MRCAEKSSAVTSLGLLSIQYFHQTPGTWTREPANFTITQHEAENDSKNGETQAENTNDLHKMEKCLEKKDWVQLSQDNCKYLYLGGKERVHKNGGRI